MNDFFKYVERIAPGFWPRVGIAIAIFLIAWLIGTIVKAIICRTAKHLPAGKARVLRLIGSSSKIVILLVGAITALAMAGVDVKALVAGLGLSGFALGFALKDALSNLLAGALILIYQPFECGDVIEVAGSRGQVTEINLRYTVLQCDDKTHLVPNSILYTNKITLEEKAEDKKTDSADDEMEKFYE